MMMTVFLLPVILTGLVFVLLFRTGNGIHRKMTPGKIKKTVNDGKGQPEKNNITGRIFLLAAKNHGTVTLS